MKKFLFTPLIFALLTACALDDTAENRSQQAGRYLKTVSPKKMLEKMLEKMAVKLPPDQRAIFKDLMTKHFNSNALEKVMVAGLLKHFTAEELRALADFHESSVGHSAMENFGDYTEDIMPAVRSEMFKAHARTKRELEKMQKRE